MLIYNIPRRKIYEELLLIEEGILEIKRMFFKKELFEIFKEEFPLYIQKIVESYTNIKILLVFFLKNRVFKNEEEFIKEKSKLESKTYEIEKILRRYNKIIPKKFFQVCSTIDQITKKIERIVKSKNKKIEFSDYQKFIKNFLEELDKFDEIIPRILEIPRYKIEQIK